MELKSLKIFGFKSFPDETTFELEPGITAVVGPNGCGKSNIVEAIRWTLGEQNVHSLRAESAEDLIFNGSETRKAMGMAEVSLTLTNTGSSNLPFSEIAVTRRIFRSGVSEYFINKVPCRLKDIAELFMDTGIGVNAYSIMSQQQVDMILNSKPQERRCLFEEAAGITKYNKRKNEALRKLELTRQNLVRIQDIIAELERQSNSLRRQVSKAERYRDLRKELNELELLRAFLQYREVEEERQKVEEKIKNIGRDRDTIMELLRQEEKSFENLKSDLAKLEDRIEEKREEELFLSTEIEKGNSLILVNEERIRNLRVRVEEGKQRKVKLQRELASIIEDVEEQSSRLEEAIRDQEKLQVQIKEDSEKIPEIVKEEKEKEKILEEKNSQLIELLSERARYKNILESLRINTHNLGVKTRRSEAELNELQRENSSLTEELARKNGKMDRNRVLLEKGEEEIKSLENTVMELKGKVKEMDENIIALKSNYQMKKSYLSTLKEIDRRQEGLQPAVKYILDCEESSSVYGLVFDLLEAPEKLQKAIEVALRDSIQGLIVKDCEAVYRLITLLKEKESGRTTFLPFENIKTEEAKISSQYELAIEKVKFPKKFSGVFSYLLGRTIIVKSLDEAVKLYSSVPEGFTIVTYEGELLHPRGLIQGGSKGETEVLIGRKRRIDGLEEELNLLEGKLKRMEEERAVRLSEVRRVEEQLRRKQAESEDMRKELLESERQISSASQRIDELRRREKLLSDEVRTLQEQMEAEEEKKKEQQHKLQSLEEKINKHNSLIESYKNSYESLKEEEKKITQSLENRRIQLVSLNESINRGEEILRRLEERKRMLSEVLPGIDKEIEEGTKKDASFGREISEAKRKLQKQAGIIKSLKEELKNLKEERAFSTERVRGKEKIIREKQRELEEKRNILQTLEIEKTRMETQIKDLIKNAQLSYGVALDRFTPEPARLQQTVGEEKSIENLDIRIDDLKRRLERMGNVNLAAIEEERELTERYNFYLDQQNDLLSSEESLIKTIRKINSTARSLFKSTFEAVRREFQVVFENLFQGGEGDLRLVGSNDVLEAGVDIIIHPPGKKLTSISLLSGGERALSAIALLFSLFRVKASPFCILDEVDAALDEPNIERFTAFLKQLVPDTQFIIISHNKRTLSASDVLYGVTMEEPGVSKLISVKFAKPAHRVAGGKETKVS